MTTDATSLTQRILDLNSQATVCLQRREYAEAVTTLHGCLQALPQVEALLLIREHLPGDPTSLAAAADVNRGAEESITVTLNAFRNEDAAESIQQEADAKVMTTCALPINVGSKKVDVARFYNAQGGFYFFDQAIVTTSLDAADGDIHPRFLQAVLMFNLGLALHQQGILPEGDRLFCTGGNPVCAAFSFYEMALISLRDLCESPAPLIGLQQDDIFLLMLAIGNNMGHIHGTYFCNFEQARVCIQQIRDLLDHTKANASALIPAFPRPRPFYNSETWRFFFLNILAVPSGFYDTSGAA